MLTSCIFVLCECKLYLDLTSINLIFGSNSFNILRKTVAGLLLIIYLFNIGGKLLMHQYFEHISANFFKEQTRKGLYNVNDLTEIKLSVNMTDMTDRSAYQDISGQVQFANASYNYVKMKITRHAIYLMCVPNYETTRLNTTNIICAKGIKDAPVHSKEHVPYQKSSSINKFNLSFLQFKFSVFPAQYSKITSQSSSDFTGICMETPKQPPRLFC
jgi:hypothetical protein